ncbi:MAG TPA: Lrp/AsnC family transcriptional regulator [Longimicrobiales bacterium]|jgi:Lrp/AsnC family transcriptional regulator, leucine-responsive regulatory protein|nr:Lrp/AsnC family transcriptional regulator [Longimicrobiales bacterium]
MIDDVDRTILDALQQNARTSNAEIARRVGMAPSAIFQRVRKLEESGLIQGYTARLNAKALGYGLVAFIMVQTRDNASSVDTAGLIAELPEVLEVHRVVGEDCFIVKARVRDTDHLAELLEHRLQPIRSIASTRTTIVVKTVKDRDDLPMASANGSG